MKDISETHPSLNMGTAIATPEEDIFVFEDKDVINQIQKHTIDKSVLKEAFNISEEWWDDMWGDHLDMNEVIESYKKEVFKNLGLEELVEWKI